MFWFLITLILPCRRYQNLHAPEIDPSSCSIEQIQRSLSDHVLANKQWKKQVDWIKQYVRSAIGPDYGICQQTLKKRAQRSHQGSVTILSSHRPILQDLTFRHLRATLEALIHCQG